jgi:hypothetical protein
MTLHSPLLAIPGILPAGRLERASARDAGFGLGALAGRLAEISSAAGGALSTFAFSLVLEAQRAGVPCAWLTRRGSSFYPPDAERGGVDLGALPVIRTEPATALFRAASHLLRSGAFGLCVIDLLGPLLGSLRTEIPTPLCARVAQLAVKHDAAVVVLTQPSAVSLGSLVSLRAETRAVRLVPGSFRVTLHITKDKRRAPGARIEEVACGPPGLR